MVLSLKDLIATGFATLIFGVYFSVTQGYEFVFIKGYHEGIIAISLIGLAMCITSGSEYSNLKKKSKLFFGTLSFLGILTLLMIIYGLLIGSQLAFIFLTILILMMWMLTTFYNLIFS